MLTFSRVGYATQNKHVRVDGDTEVKVSLTRQSIHLPAVEITETRRVQPVTKMDVPLFDMPVTVSSVNNRLINQTQSLQINEITPYLTGVYTEKHFGVKQTFILRGLSQPVVLVDGVRNEAFNNDPYEQPLTSLTAVERVGFLKGPEAVLYGHSAVGGVLSIMRKQPTSIFKANAAVTYGSWNTKRLQLGASGNLARGLNYRFDAGLATSDGFRNLPYKFANTYLALDYTLNRRNKIELRLGTNNDRYTPDGGIPFVRNDIRDLNGNVVYKKGDLLPGVKYDMRWNSNNDFMTNKNYNALLRYIHHFSQKTKLTYQLSYTDDKVEYLNSGEGYANPMQDTSDDTYKHEITLGKEKKYIDIGKFILGSVFRHHMSTKGLHNYLELSAQFNTGAVKHNLLAGYMFQNNQRRIFYPNSYGSNAVVDVAKPDIFSAAIPASVYVGAMFYNEQSHGLYLQNLVELLPQLKAMVGIRADYYSYQRKLENTQPGTMELEDKNPYFKGRNIPFSFQGGLVYNPVKDMALYASYSTFFKPNRHSYSENYLYFDKDGNQITFKEGGKLFDPESGYQAEAELKYNFSRYLKLNISGYIIHKNNVVVGLGYNADKKYQYGQISGMQSKGIEVDVASSPTNGLYLQAGYSLVAAKHAEHSTDKFGKFVDGGKSLPNLPKHQLFGRAEYTVLKGALRNLSFNVGARYGSQTVTALVETSSLTLPGRFLVDAGMGYSFGQTYMRLNVNNLLNKQYYSYNRTGLQLLPGEERNVLFTVGVNIE